MTYKHIIALFVFSLTSVFATSQVCILDIGSKNSEKVIETFQLKEKQLETLKVLKDDVKLATDAIDEKVKVLLETHPQSTPEELTVLAEKHKELEEEMFGVIIEYDQKLISIFNEKQYERYVLLCNTASRTPITITEE
ncbi:hypothetical protein H0I23_09695 [Cellulophaga sp. HaHaR_3_176]|uniref:hypothetical protein n=1 Tax=Cellulophaga sp. HaHaR_3_176 TaxID=1942464 RepID=UPI001C1F4705|nr:hypothetical protein [Cellulophaga sp. HaHaR_3_176]QWX82740.1 hypothetical protein H0I23_09695 [Cellulophaga sp. HaHaR_3_176]